MIKQFYLTYKWDSNRFYHSESADLGVMTMNGVLHIPQRSRTGASSSDDLESLENFYPSAEMQMAYSPASTNWTAKVFLLLDWLSKQA